MKVLDGSAEWNVALVASSAAVERVNNELSDKLSNLLIETGTAYFDNISSYSGETREIHFSRDFPVDSFSIVATLNANSAYWGNIRVSISGKDTSKFALTLWNDGSSAVSDLYVFWQAIYDGRN